MKPDQPTDIELRRRVEERLQKQGANVSDPKPEADKQRLLHELQVHQIELEMQNEELRNSRAEVEKLKDRYYDLYDFSPVGFVSLEQSGAIIQINLAGARLLGSERAGLTGSRFAFFVAGADRPAFNAFLQQVFATETRQTCEVALTKKDRPPAIVQIEAILSPDRQECSAVLVDVTLRRQAEEKIIKLNEVLEQKVNERTAELKKTIAQLEETNHVFVGRELKMVELKKRIAELEKT
jgi:PAS domain S-box-containing protein